MTYIFESGLAHHIEGLIQQKRADGYAYNSEEKLLKRFDTFCVQNYPELTTVTYEMAANRLSRNARVIGERAYTEVV